MLAVDLSFLRDRLERSFAPLFFYAGVIFLIYLADGIMAYLAPVIIEQHVGNSFVMGVVIATSSVVGIFCDTFFPHVFRHKKHFFFLWNTIIFGVLFPLIFLGLPHQLSTFFLAMAMWGIYFEFLVFSNFYFIHAFVKHEHHAFAWGILGIFRTVGGLISPIAASELHRQQENLPLKAAILFWILAGVTAMILKIFFDRHHKVEPQPSELAKHSIWQELKKWHVLFRRIWPLYLLISMIFIVEATFFTIGVLISEEMLAQSFWGSLVIPAYLLPSLFTNILIEKITKRWGKKRTAFVSAVLAGILLFLSYLVSLPEEFIMMIFLSAIFSSLTLPAIQGTIQDYVARLDEHKGNIIGLQNSAGSLAYIVGPILAGGLAVVVGNRAAFSVVGILLSLVGLLCLTIVPRKILMPQTELAAADGKK